MAPDARTRSPRRVLLALAIILVLLCGGTAATAKWGHGQLTPKLGLDLEGGTEMVLQPVLADPKQQVNQGQLDKARDIIQQRVDAFGVSEAEVATQGGRNIVVDIPGTPTTQQLDAVRKPSQLRFRAVLTVDYGSPQAASKATGTGTTGTGTTGTGTTSGTGTGTTTAKPSTATTPPPVFTPNAPATASQGATSANGAIPDALLQDTTTPTGGATTPAATATTGAVSTAPATAPATPTVKPTDASDLAWITADVEKQFTALDCSKREAVSTVVDDPAKPLVACSQDLSQKYILGPVEVDGTDISDATSGYQTGPTGQPTSIVEVALTFTSDGSKKFGDVTTRLLGLKGVQNQFAIVLDKSVISAPTTNAAITNGKASITGSFTIESARSLASQLKFGALPMSFALQTQEDVSPTLGQEQLTLGLLAGLIGLLLVVGYSLLQYHLLGLVTIASLVLAGVITFVTLTFLGWSYNFRLTMAGVTGVIVAIGVTADSFIVYFERVRDEVRDGRPLVAAVDAGWKRARRTILAADAVNFLAAGVLYFLAASNVRGFAFTLGVTTLIDLVVVILFTHPVLALIAHTQFFGGGHRWSGLDPDRLGATIRYVGRGRFAGPRPASAASAASVLASQSGAARAAGSTRTGPVPSTTPSRPVAEGKA